MKKILTDKQKKQIRKNKQTYEEKTKYHPYTVRALYESRKAIKKLAEDNGYCSECKKLTGENENLNAKYEELLRDCESLTSKVKSLEKNKSTNANIESHISNAKNSRDAATNRDYVITAISSILLISYCLATMTIL